MCITSHQELEPRLNEKKKVERKPAGANIPLLFPAFTYIVASNANVLPHTPFAMMDENSRCETTSPFFHELLFFFQFITEVKI